MKYPGPEVGVSRPYYKSNTLVSEKWPESQRGDCNKTCSYPQTSKECYIWKSVTLSGFLVPSITWCSIHSAWGSPPLMGLPLVGSSVSLHSHYSRGCCHRSSSLRIKWPCLADRLMVHYFISNKAASFQRRVTTEKKISENQEFQGSTSLSLVFCVCINVGEGQSQALLATLWGSL